LPPGSYHLRVTVLDGSEPAGQTVGLATVEVVPAD
jgi:hypothetical protein